MSSTRVSLFFDGQNFFRGLKAYNPSSGVDYNALRKWIVARVGELEGIADAVFARADYFTAVPTPGPDAPDFEADLARFLDGLELQPGFFVHRFPKREERRRCSACGAETAYYSEKGVDSSLVTDMVRLGSIGAYDIAVLFSGDADMVPAVEAVQAMGRKVYAASWGREGLSRDIERSVFGVVDLAAGLTDFGLGTTNGAAVAVEQERVDAVFLHELRRAQDHFGETGYVGAAHFLNRWRGEGFPSSPDVRRASLERLKLDGLVEVVEGPNGVSMLRVVARGGNAGATSSSDDRRGVGVTDAEAGPAGERSGR